MKAIRWGVLLLLLAPGLAFSAGRRPEPFKVLTLDATGMPLGVLAARLKDSPYDLIALQGMRREEDALELAKESGLPYHAFFAPNGPLGAGLSTLSRYPIAEEHRQAFSCQPTPLRFVGEESLADKGVLMTRVTAPQGPLDAYNTDLIPDSPKVRYPTLRLTQLFELSETVARHSGQTPLLVLGDLNAGRADREFWIFADLLGLEDPCLQDARDLCVKDEARRLVHTLLPRAGRSPAASPSAAEEGLAAELGGRFWKLRLKPEPLGRSEALRRIQSAIGRMTDAMLLRQREMSWIPVYGFILTLRYDRQLAGLWALKARVETARIETLSQSPPIP